MEDIAGRKPVLAVFMSAQALPDLSTRDRGRVPGYRTPEPAAIALGHAAHYAAWREGPVQSPPAFADIQLDDAGLLLAEALRRDGGWLAPDEVRQLLSRMA